MISEATINIILQVLKVLVGLLETHLSAVQVTPSTDAKVNS